MAAEIVISSATKSLPLLYKSLVKREKERFDTIVEPLQCVLQLAFLAFCDKNAKLAIQNNIVYIQFPSSYQGIIRWYQNDSKEDLYFLFNAVRRFSLFYKHLKQIKTATGKHSLYDTLVHYAVIGLQKLIDTYTNQGKPSLLYTIQMYKVLLETPDNFKVDSLESETQQNIDDVFNTITNIYNEDLYWLLYYFICSLKSMPEVFKHGNIERFNQILLSSIDDIQTWISKHVIY